jgi:flagellar biogenesis protein FliO
MALVAVFASWPTVAAIAQTEPPVRSPDEPGTTAAPPSGGLADAWSVVEPSFSKSESPTLQRPSGRRTSPLLAGNAERSERPWGRTVLALAGVVGLIVLLAWGYRAIAGGNVPLVGKARRPGVIEVISKVSLSARQSLCLVRVGTRMVLIGQSADNLRALDVIDDAELTARLSGEAARRRPDGNHAAFQSCLAREAQEYQPDTDEIDEQITPDQHRVGAAQRHVADAIRRIRRATAQG